MTIDMLLSAEVFIFQSRHPFKSCFQDRRIAPYQHPHHLHPHNHNIVIIIIIIPLADQQHTAQTLGPVNFLRRIAERLRLLSDQLNGEQTILRTNAQIVSLILLIMHGDVDDVSAEWNEQTQSAFIEVLHDLQPQMHLS